MGSLCRQFYMGLNVIFVNVIMTFAVITSLLTVFLVGLYSTNAKESIENDRPIIGKFC